MSKKMLIDAAHAEETRVVVIDGSRVEEFDFESRSRKQLRGNIYLAKVTRVEPSLQAAFIEYGGNRHGFLAFNEIHPDYYQIPLADREALMREEAEEEEAHAAGRGPVEPREDETESVSSGDDDDDMDEQVERRRRRLLRRYKIQEVIKRRQIMLVQVVKEERGNKGAALTSYLSLAGRYGVLMPNTARGGGISRKIEAASDRKRLKSVVQALDLPHGMGLIIRTAGAKRTKLEISRDYEYLMRLWDSIRETTLHSIAPALIYEEEDLVKRAIRDMFDKDIESVFVEGEAGYREARDFMRMLMPAQAKKVHAYREPAPLFVKHNIEDSLSQIYSPVVPLRSGGYLVINQTEALVAVDVNSGRATKERNIEATALKTNMEAAEEAVRQLRLRDLAGLIVIDFIDMDESKNNRAVEKKLKDCLKDDRARVQMGKISPFGLMEISRQRRRTGVLEGTTHVCEHCNGSGRVRSTESSALACLRAIEMEAFKGGAGSVTLRVPRAVGLYILNEKRGYLERLNQTNGLFVTVLVDDAVAHAEHIIDRTSSTEFEPRPDLLAPPIDDDDDFVFEDEEEDDEEIVAAESDEDEEGGGSRPPREDRGERGRGRHRGRSGRGGRDGRDEPRAAEPVQALDDDQDDGDDEGDDEGEARVDGEGRADAFDASGRRRRRRGRRGGKRMREEGAEGDPYGWSRMRAPDGDPYVWMEPGQAQPQGEARPPQAPHQQQQQHQLRPADAEPRGDGEERKGRRRRRGGRGRDRDREPREPRIESTAAVAEAFGADEVQVIAAPRTEAPTDEIWVELPPVEDAPAKSGRGRRGRGKARPETVTEEAALEVALPTPIEAPVIEAAPEPEAEPAAKPKSRSRAKKAPPVVEASPASEAEPVAEAAPAPRVEPEPPAAPREPDPAEISGAPPAPRRGWWRRGA